MPDVHIELPSQPLSKDEQSRRQMNTAFNEEKKVKRAGSNDEGCDFNSAEEDQEESDQPAVVD